LAILKDEVHSEKVYLPGLYKLEPSWAETCFCNRRKASKLHVP